MTESSTLVVLIAQDRELDRNRENLVVNVLEPLKADLAICGSVTAASNDIDFAYLWAFEEPDDWAEEIRAQGLTAEDLIDFQSLGPEFLAGVDSGPGSAAIVYFWRHRLGQLIQPLLPQMNYDWFVITRSDMRWAAPFPPVDNLDPRRIYFLNGEHYGGVSDRFVLFPRSLAKEIFSLYSPLFDNPGATLAEIRRYRTQRGRKFRKFNAEFYQKFVMDRAGLGPLIRYLPYIGFAIRSRETGTRWSEGTWDVRGEYFVKYPSERRQARIFAKWISEVTHWGSFPAGPPSSRLLAARMDWMLKRMRRRVRNYFRS